VADDGSKNFAASAPQGMLKPAIPFMNCDLNGKKTDAKGIGSKNLGKLLNTDDYYPNLDLRVM